MASFKNRTRDEIPSATLITQLTPIRSAHKSPSSGSETWCCAFSPDEAYFAWSSGNSVVTLIPWNRCKSTLFKCQHFRAQHKSGFRVSVDNTDEQGHCSGRDAVTIHTGSLVRAVTFGSSTSDQGHRSSPAFWTRFSTSKDLVLATGHSNGRIRTWDVLTGKLMLELMDHRDMVSHLTFCPSGNLILVSASYDGTLKVWDLHEDGNMFQTMKMNGKPICSCCWSPDARTMVSVGMCKLVYVWDMTSYTVRLQLKGHQHDVVACAFSPDSCLIATASWDTRVLLWDAYSGQMLKYFGHLHPLPRLIYACGDNGTWIRGLSFSSDGAHVATVADDGYLRFWDVSTEENPEAVGAVEDSLCCSYAPSGRVLAVGSRNGVVSFWRSSTCVKQLLFLSRIAVRKLIPADSIDKLQIPSRLVKYLKYEEWD